MLVPTRDLPAGHTLTAADLHSVVRVAEGLPANRLQSAFGLTLATPVRAGELITDTRVLGPGLLTGLGAGTVAAPIRLTDPATTALVRAGDRIDVLASASTSTWPTESGQADATDLPDGTDVPGSSDARRSTAVPGGTDPGGTNNTPSGADNGTDSDSDTSTSAGGGASGSGSGGDSLAERVVSGALVLAVCGGASGDGSGLDPSGGGGGSSLSGLGSGGGIGGLGQGGTQSGDSGSGTAGVIMLAVSPSEAARLAAAQTGSALSIVVLPRS